MRFAGITQFGTQPLFGALQSLLLHRIPFTNPATNHATPERGDVMLRPSERSAPPCRQIASQDHSDRPRHESPRVPGVDSRGTTALSAGAATQQMLE